jgi:hypothetical protein
MFMSLLNLAAELYVWFLVACLVVGIPIMLICGSVHVILSVHRWFVGSQGYD